MKPGHCAGRRRQGTRLERTLAYTSPGSEPAIMGAVDDSHYSLVIAAAQAAGPCPVGEEAAWGRRVHGLTVDLYLIAQQARQDIERLESARTFIAFLEKGVRVASGKFWSDIAEQRLCAFGGRVLIAVTTVRTVCP